MKLSADRFRLSSMLWAIAVIALCLGWAVDHYSRRVVKPIWPAEVGGIRTRIEL